MTPWTTAHQASPSMGFSRQEYWKGVPLPSPKIQHSCSKLNLSINENHIMRERGKESFCFSLHSYYYSYHLTSDKMNGSSDTASNSLTSTGYSTIKLYSNNCLPGDNIRSPRLRAQFQETSPHFRCQLQVVGPQVIHNSCLTRLQIKGFHDLLPFGSDYFLE